MVKVTDEKLAEFQPVVDEFLKALEIDAGMASQMLWAARSTISKREAHKRKKELRTLGAPTLNKYFPKGWDTQDVIELLSNQEPRPAGITSTRQHKRVTPELKAQLIAETKFLRDQGVLWKDIADKLGFTAGCLCRWLLSSQRLPQ